MDPGLFARQLLQTRNQAQRPGHPHAVLQRVLVFRGEPSPEHDSAGYSRNQAQKSYWERDRRVRVHLRPLKYEYVRDGSGGYLRDPATRERRYDTVREKGVDVLCALALVREALADDVDMVILASSDSDLEPALDEVLRLSTAKLETCCWYNAQTRIGYQVHPTDRSRRIWNTRLPEPTFRASRDLNDYR